MSNGEKNTGYQDILRAQDRRNLELKAGQLRDGDVLVFRASIPVSMEAAERVMANVGRWIDTLPVKVYPLLLDEGLSLETISAETMRDLGWVRVDQLAEAP